jgi:membrane protein YdbS with pleckstrin-like domain
MAEAIKEERRQVERRRGDRRRTPGRRADDVRRTRLNIAIALFWAMLGSAVVLYLFFAVVGTVDPSENKAAAIVVLVLAVIWLAHAWRRLYAGGFVSRPDRERRGF